MTDGPGQPPNQDNKTRLQGRTNAVGKADHTRIAKPKLPPDAPPKQTGGVQPKQTAGAQGAAPGAKAEVQLTQIRQAIREQNSSQGFTRAKLAADKALAANKIILNNRFVLEATLGAGGMGTVYKAKDLRKVEANDPNPYVAVKVLNDDFKNHPDAFVTLQREASRSHILSHPNIVTVHDFDRDGDVIYMTMELLQGQGLEAMIRQHRQKGLAREQVLKIIRDIGQALAYAHQKHIVHSDLKPGNIFVCTDSSTKVLDFGIARVTNQAAGDFDAGSLGALTPAYASLEMLNGEDPHPADDVYALAIIAYELFTGEHPYQRKPADVALQEKLRPAPVKTLNKQQWKALERGLKLRRAERIQDISVFYKGLTQRRRSITGLLAATVLLSALVATAAYRFFVGDQLDARITETYQRGQTCLSGGDVSCALDSAKAVLQLDANHEGARELLQSAEAQWRSQREDELAARIDNCISTGDENCAKDALRQMRELDPGAASLPLLQARLQEFQQRQIRQQILAEAQACAAKGDWDCVIRLSGALPSADTELQALRADAEKARAAQQQERAQQEREYQLALQQAEECLQRRDYVCAEKKAQLAVATEVDPLAAQTLVQRIAFARNEYHGNLQKAKNVLAKGEACLQKKNFSCAIANSESALEFVPDYPPALQLRLTAQQAVEQLKTQIKIE